MAMLGWGEDEQVTPTLEALLETANSLVTVSRCCCCSAHAQWLKLASKLQWKNKSGRQIKNFLGKQLEIFGFVDLEMDVLARLCFK